MSALQVELVAADRKVWQGEAAMVSARSIDGDLGIMPGHTPILGVLVTGEVRIKSTGGSTETVTIDGGFLSVDHDRVVIVADRVDAGNLASQDQTA
ncbi:F0F1 ATP synthase subunit epsilon [Ornithinimicrobium panacihumi]|uniref:F0F1 ATP synthase subunit epsilon n=1 Tax=Ornithinimicrobium panacihumi TaxID=2008449 RepID=UPI003F8A9077